MRLVDLSWEARDPPLPTSALLCPRPVVQRLARTLLRLSEDELGRRLRGVLAEREWMVLLGEYADLPWSDGVSYFGRLEAVPELYLPTTLKPAVAEDLLLAALRPHLPAGPLLYCPHQQLAIPLVEARPLAVGRLTQLAAGTLH